MKEKISINISYIHNKNYNIKSNNKQKTEMITTVSEKEHYTNTNNEKNNETVSGVVAAVVSTATTGAIMKKAP
eukprot:10427789-Ditylum_brightwellii.AAC.1